MLRYAAHDPCAIQLACMQFRFFSRFLVNTISFFYSGCCKSTSAWLWTKRKKHFTTQDPDQVGPQTLWSSMRTNSKILFDGLNRINFILGTCIFTSPYFLNINCRPFIDNQAPIYKIIVVKQNFPTVFFLCVCRLRTIEMKKQNDFFGPLKGLESIISVTILWMVNSFSTLGFFATVNYVIELLQTKTNNPTVESWNKLLISR